MLLQRHPQPELLDLGAYPSLKVLHDNLQDMARFARWLGVPQEVAVHLPDAAQQVIDIGCGSGDLLRRLIKRVLPALAVGLDRNPDVLHLARLAGHPSIQWLRGDARRLPFADAAFDVALCVHVLHHFSPSDAAQVLAECARVARVKCIVVDLQRSAFALIGAWFLTRLTSRNPLTRIDGVRSVRNAYTAAEARALAHAAGWSNVAVHTAKAMWVMVHQRLGA
ncbi:MAG: class I SAM-dependent methyltransferase [Thermoflexales bacterium]|nr:class I SAM-dependent methyltransferase [Thermoflexales bacterium]MDW8052997.1 class I SAM-dependent methyltransferase [Anaerolineae bacterium]MDW8291650.1 class I SAM-dependent methyltransferase [Anaerolineae bacterium]